MAEFTKQRRTEKGSPGEPPFCEAAPPDEIEPKERNGAIIPVAGRGTTPASATPAPAPVFFREVPQVP